MSNDNKTMHEFDLDMICEYFSNVERQGPGSPEVTKKALSFVGNLDEGSHIMDIGCGTGGQTMVLAQETKGKIIGLDLFPRFIDLFNYNARKLNIDDRVEGMVGNMEELPFSDNEFDLIWSEGSIYNIGFERGLKEWRKYLKTGGFIAVSEASWFTDERPEEINKFWMEAYPGIDTVPNKVAQLQKAGYIAVASFILPVNCWTDHFYIPQLRVQEEFLKKYGGNRTAEEFIDYQRYEKRLYDRYNDYYGYAFYIGQKR